jgi:hypothetical protein
LVVKKTQDRIAVWMQLPQIDPIKSPPTQRKIKKIRAGMHSPVPVDEAPRRFGCAMAAREEREGTRVNGGGDCSLVGNN